MLLEYSVYYKKFGIRRLGQLFNPPINTLDQLHLSRESTYHYVSHDVDVVMPDANSSLFSGYGKKVWVSHVSTLTSTEGAPKPLNKLVKALFRDWHLKNNKLFKYVEDPTAIVPDALTLVVYNYGLLHATYRYLKTPMADYYRWFNIEKTRWDNIATVVDKTQRQQFVIVDTPKVLPSVGMLKMFSGKVSIRTTKIFDNSERRMVLELWKWIDPATRGESTLSSLSKEQALYTNVIFRYENSFTILNLGKLEEWRAGNEGNTENAGQPMLPVFMLQKFVLKLMMGLQANAPAAVDEEDRDEELSEPDTHSEMTQALMPNVTANATQTEPEYADSFVSHLNNLDDDLAVLEKLDQAMYSDEETVATDSDTEEEDELSEVALQANSDDAARITASIYQPADAMQQNRNTVAQLAEDGVITAAAYKDLLKQIAAAEQVKNPYDSTQLLSDYTPIAAEELALSDEGHIAPHAAIADKSMAKTTLTKFDANYVGSVIKKDILAGVQHLSNAGVLIKDYQIEKEISALGKYEIHSVKLRPLDGVESTVYFRVPEIDQDGELYIASNKARMRKQRSDLPIRKISHDSVALSSYYGKVFVNRTERRQYDEVTWLADIIREIGMAGGNETIRKVTPGNVFNNHLKVPRIYSGLSMHFKYIDTANYHLVFDHQERLKLLDIEQLAKIEINGWVLCGHTRKKEPILVNPSGLFSIYRDNSYVAIGNVYQLLMLDASKAPIQYSELKIFSKAVPLAVVLGYYFGLSDIIKLVQGNPKVLSAKARYTPSSDEWVMRFSDYKLVFNKTNTAATLLLSGMLFYKDTLRQFKYSDFDARHVYMNVLDQRGINVRYLKELDTLKQLFVDPITRGVLEEMHEPTAFTGLLVRANELLMSDWHPDSNDLRYMRIKGYERVAGMVYKELVNSVRDYRSRNIRGKSQISMAPYAVWRAITQDQTVKMSEDINPINDLKEIEAVTYVGADGRAKDAMTKTAREYHNNDMGTISESTVDSGDVSINTYMSGNPQLTNLRGVTRDFDMQRDGSTSLLSSSALLAPGAVNDDPKRVNFIGVQNAHTVACAGYRQPYLKTGYEYVVPYRVGKLYAYMAEQDGRVAELSDKVIIVEYADGSKTGVKLGRQYGRAEGSIYPHDITTTLVVGKKFIKGDTIAYNTQFFEPDMLDPNRIVLKSHMVARVALMESTQTLEDASSISRHLSDMLQTRVVKEKTFTVSFKQNIRNITPTGTELTPKDILLILEDEITSGIDIFDSDTIESLSRLSNLAPKAKVKGVLDRYEVYYNGDLEDMSPTLRKFTQQCNREMTARSAGTDYPITNGRVTEEFRVEGKALQLDTAVIKVYIVVSDKASLGDKCVFANQMKSVISEVLYYDVKTETGSEIEAIFSYKSLNNRIVNSPQMIGTTITLLKKIAENAVAMYDK